MISLDECRRLTVGEALVHRWSGEVMRVMFVG